jgi:hypothetical protein
MTTVSICSSVNIGHIVWALFLADGDDETDRRSYESTLKPCTCDRNLYWHESYAEVKIGTCFTPINNTVKQPVMKLKPFFLCKSKYIVCFFDNK